MLSETKEEVSSNVSEIGGKILFDVIPSCFTNANKVAIDNFSKPHLMTENKNDRIEVCSNKIIVVGFSARELQTVIDHFGTFGKIIKFESNPLSNFVAIKYKHEFEAKKALKSYNAILLDSLERRRIIQAEFHFEKMNQFKLKENEEKIQKEKQFFMTAKIPGKSFKEKIWEYLYW
jgi:hypothetical protein